MKIFVFAKRNIKEILRDPLSWLFCLGFPLLMLAVMSLVNKSIPPQAEMTLFRIENLAPGISVFGLTFIMLFACMLIAGDRSEAFLLRIFTSPMRSFDYIIGYIIPLIILAIGQYLITGTVSKLIDITQEHTLDVGYMLTSVMFTIPSIIMYVSFGLMFGTILGKNSAPGICSIIITLSGMLGGVWMDIKNIGGVLEKIADALPFVHTVNCSRYAYQGAFGNAFAELGIVSVWAVVITIITIVLFRKKMTF